MYGGPKRSRPRDEQLLEPKLITLKPTIEQLTDEPENHEKRPNSPLEYVALGLGSVRTDDCLGLFLELAFH